MRESTLEKQISLVPKKVIWCKKCVMSNQRPRIIFDEEGICSGCRNNETKQKTNWKEREKELIDLLDQHRSKTKAKVITTANQNKGVCHQEPITQNKNRQTA